MDNNITRTACYLSHLRAVKYAMESPTEWTLILEDDATFKKIPNSIMRKLSNILDSEKYDAAWLSDSGTSECYLLNKKGARIMYSYMNQRSEFTINFVKTYNKDCLHDWTLSEVFKKIRTFYSNNFSMQRCDDTSYITNDNNPNLCSNRSIVDKIFKFIRSFDYV